MRPFFPNSRITVVVLALLLAPFSLRAQVQDVSGSVATPIPGAGHDYIHMLNETVNPATGSLSIRIDVPTPKGRGLTLPFAFLYNSSGVNQPFVNPSNYTASWWNTSSQFNGVGWTYTIPALTAIEGVSSNTDTTTYPPRTYTCYWVSNYVLQAIDSSRHLLPISVGEQSGDGTCGPLFFIPSTVLFSGDAHYQASTLPNSSGQFPRPVTIADLSGTVYQFSSFGITSLPGPIFTPGTGTAFYAYPTYIKDRNGNILQVTTSGGTTTLTDSVGRNAVVISPLNSTTKTNTITVSGLSNSYNLQWGTASSNFTTGTVVTGGYCSSSSIQANSQTSQVVQTLTLPNGKSYQFSYDSKYGLLNKIVYPSGGSVTYTWGENALAEDFSFPVNNVSGVSGAFCSYEYGLPAITKRVVSFDGVNPALEQDFQYSTTWNNGSWISKQTIVTTKDLIGGQSFETAYSYVPMGTPNPPNGSGGPTPVEQKTTYYKDLGTTIAKTVTKAWLDEYRLACELDTLDNGLISGAFHSYGSSSLGPIIDQLTDKKEYDYGLITSTSACLNSTTAPSGITPTRENVISYATFAATPSFPTAPSIFDRPSQVITYGNGSRATEADYTYDQTAVSAVTNLSATTHDETNYSPSFNTRGNATTVMKQCFQGAQTCTNPATTFTYDETGQILTMTDPCGNATCNDMPSGVSHTTNYFYADNFDSNPTSSTNAYVPQITSPPTNSVNHIQKFKYAYADGQLVQSTDQNNQVSSYFYADPLRRLTETDFPDGGKTTIAHNDTTYNSSTPSPSVNATRAMTSSSNVTSLVAFDGLGHTVRSVLTSDPDCASGDRTDTTYDGLGRVYTVSNPYCTTSDSTYGLTTYTYDALGRTTQVAHPDGATILTNYTGRATQVQDEGNGTQPVTRISQTDGLGRLSSLCEVAPGPFIGANGASTSSLIGSSGAPVTCGQDIAGTGFLTTYQYDSLSNLLQVNQSGIAPRTFTYDSLSRLLTASNPESGAISYTYDSNGNLLTKTAPAPNQTGTTTVTTTYQYDALNRLTKKSYNDGATPSTTFAYDSGCDPTYYHNQIGRLDVSSVPGWASCIGYDTIGRLADKDMYDPKGNLYYLDYSYDLFGNITSQTAGYGTASYTYNTAGRPITVTSSYSDPNNPATVFSAAHYNAFGGLTSDTLGNGETETYSYVPKLTRLQSYTAKLNATTIYNFNIGTFAPNGDILAANDSANGNWTYSYDPFNRLVGANKNSGQAVHNYVYDRFGNRWQQNGPQSFLATFTGNNPGSPQNNNRMDGYSYDAAGNLLNDGTHSYTYDAENHITKVDNGTTATYVYDADGNRVQKTAATGGGGDPAGTWQFLYDQSGRMIQRFDGTFWQGNIFVGGRHLVEDGGGTNFSHSDWLGTERVRTTNTGSICESIASLPFGDGQTTTGACYQSSPLHFTGKERDSESGLDNFGARYDSSSMGRFLSPDWSDTPDPIPYADLADPQTLNLYAYTGNNPINGTDDDGHDFGANGPDDYFARQNNTPKPAAKCGFGCKVVTWIVSLFYKPLSPVSAQQERSESPSSPNNRSNSLVWNDAEAQRAAIGQMIFGSQPITVPIPGGQNTVGPPMGIVPIPTNLLALIDLLDTIGSATDWLWKGSGTPGSSQGSWYNPNTKEYIHPDLQHPDPIGPHFDYRDPQGKTWRVYPDKGIMSPK